MKSMKSGLTHQEDVIDLGHLHVLARKVEFAENKSDEG